MASKEGEAGPLRWDDAHMKVSYANVCNVSTSREEVVLSFGTLASGGPDPQDAVVAISDRLVLNPTTAKQVHALLQAVLREYEARYGPLPDPGRPAQPTVKSADPP